MSALELEAVTVQYGAVKALDTVSLKIDDGQFHGLLGPSGSGKTTLLRVIAGFAHASAGSLRIDGQAIDNIPVEQRQIGMVFQNYALFPNMSVAENVAFGLQVRHLPARQIRQRVDIALALVQLEDLGARRPAQLSGGQRQRVALARAIVTEPRLLLLDEPLSALDKNLRVDMQIELKRIQRETGITTVFVTHDQEEALMLSDQISILRAGRVVQTGTPREVYHDPCDVFTAGFLGDANFLRGRSQGQILTLGDGARLVLFNTSQETAGKATQHDIPATSADRALEPLSTRSSATPDDTLQTLAIRPEHIDLRTDPLPDSPDTHQIQATLTHRVFSGAVLTALLDWQGQQLKVRLRDHELDTVADQSRVWLHWPASSARLFREDAPVGSV